MKPKTAGDKLNYWYDIWCAVALISYPVIVWFSPEVPYITFVCACVVVAISNLQLARFHRPLQPKGGAK